MENNVTKILWLSRHNMTGEQYADLQRIYGNYGNIEIKQVSKTVNGWQDVVDLGYDCDVLAVVLPISILADLTNPRNNRKPVIRAKSNRVPTGKWVLNPATGKEEEEYLFEHVGWEQIESVVLSVKEL